MDLRWKKCGWIRSFVALKLLPYYCYAASSWREED